MPATLLALGLDRVEVADGVAVVLPLLLEDHVQAGEGGLRVLGALRVPARRGQLVGRDRGEEVAHHRDAAGRTSSTSAYDGATVVKIDMSKPSSSEPASRWPMRVERLFDLQDGPAQPRVRGKDQVPQRLRERPLAVHRDVDRAGRHRRDAVERRRPGALEHGPGRAQAVRIRRPPLGRPGKAAVEFGLDERDHVDAVDAEEAPPSEATVRRCPPRPPRPRASRRRTGRTP